jgi:hypothetical protein
MALAVALNPAAPFPYKQGREFVQRVIITSSGNYAAGGVTLNLGGLETPGKNAPFEWHIFSVAASGKTYQYVPGTDRTNGKLSGFSGGTEFTDASAYPTDTIWGWFRYKLQD